MGLFLGQLPVGSVDQFEPVAERDLCQSAHWEVLPRHQKSRLIVVFSSQVGALESGQLRAFELGQLGDFESSQLGAVETGQVALILLAQAEWPTHWKQELVEQKLPFHSPFQRHFVQPKMRAPEWCSVLVHLFENKSNDHFKI